MRYPRLLILLFAILLSSPDWFGHGQSPAKQDPVKPLTRKIRKPAKGAVAQLELLSSPQEREILGRDQPRQEPIQRNIFATSRL